MKYYKNLFEPFNNNKKMLYIKNYNTNSINKIIYTFYDKINKLKDSNLKSSFSSKTLNSYKDIKCSLLDSNFIPIHIRKRIEKIKYTYTYFFIVKSNNVKITVNFLLNERNDITYYDESIKKIIIWLNFAYTYSNIKNASFLLNIYLSEEQKLLPNNAVAVLDQKNCNTAVTYACAKKGECLIYRKEEWFKVLIHECMHALCLDFSGFTYNTLKKKMSNLFPIASKFEISETYSESWATILNNVFISNEIKKNNEDKIPYFHSLMKLDIYFSIFQTVKILDFMNIYDYEYLYKKNKKYVAFQKLYKEKTNVFAYYILKMIYLYNYVMFINFCKTNNNDIINFNKNGSRGDDSLILINFFDLLKKCYKNKDLLKSYNMMKKLYNKEKKGNNMFLLYTLRMVSVDY